MRRPARLDRADAIADGWNVTVTVYAFARGPDGAAAKAPSASHGPAGNAGDAEGDTLGAGFFIDGDGHLVTAAHVVENARVVWVKLQNQRVLAATLIGIDAERDVALLRVDAAQAVAPRLGHSVTLAPGDWVVAIGDPYALGSSVMVGRVGGKERHFSEDGASAYIQTDMPLGPGNSGGPLLDASGRIVGMNSRVVVSGFGSAPLGLATPIEIVLDAAGALQRGDAERPRFGAAFGDVTVQAAVSAGRDFADGAQVLDVDRGSPAAAMGLCVGDIVTTMNGQPVGNGADLARILLGWDRVGGTRVVVLRGGRYLSLRHP